MYESSVGISGLVQELLYHNQVSGAGHENSGSWEVVKPVIILQWLPTAALDNAVEFCIVLPPCTCLF